MAPRILLVDDEPNVIKAISRALQDEPCEILTAKSGREALKLMLTTAIDIIVTDERMPGMSGVELLGAVSRIYPETTRIILTGHANTNLVFQAINDGKIYRFLTKPWDDEELVGIIRHALGDKRHNKGESLLQKSKVTPENMRGGQVGG